MKNLLVILAMFVTSSLFAQEENTAIKLKNGSEIKGHLISQDEEIIKIETKDGTIWTYKMEDVEAIGEYRPKVSRPGFYFRSNVGIMGGDQVSPSFHIVNGYSFNSHWDVGLGLGLESFWWDGYIPAYAEVRYNLLNKPFTPFVSGIAGYEMPMSRWNDNKGGFTGGARIGITKMIGSKVAFSTSIGYRYAYLTEVNSWWDDFETIREINRIEIRLGITIK